MTNAVSEFYRCPEEMIVQPRAAETGWQAGYFRFAETLCYGPSAFGACQDPDRAPMLDDDVVEEEGSPARLPFDVNRVIDNFRLERYPIPTGGPAQPLLSNPAILRLYYLFRSRMGTGFRRKLQRLYLRNWRRLTFPEWPVDTSVERLMKRLLLQSMTIRGMDAVPFIWFWPEGATGAAMMTHDVETEAGIEFLPTLMDVDESFGIRSSIQLVPEKRYKVSHDLLRTIRDRGCEVNVHGLDHDGNLFQDRSAFSTKAAQINRYVQEFAVEGFRSTCMYRKLEWLKELNVSYDMSVPNVAHLEPQRGGCCTVFPYLAGNVVELPLTTIQDYSLFHMLGEYSIDLWKQQLERITGANGLASFLIHPDYVADERSMSTYKALLAHICAVSRQKRIWQALPGEINRWWRQRLAMKLVKQDGHWSIQGEGRDRAQIAIAELRNGRIEHRVLPSYVASSEELLEPSAAGRRNA